MIHTVVSLIVYVGQATETENYFNFLLKRALKNFRANSISGDGTFRRIRCGPKTIKLIHEIVCFSIIVFYLHAVQYMMFRSTHIIASTASGLPGITSTTTTTIPF